MKKIFLVLILMVFLVSTVSAELIQFDNIVNYSYNDLKATIVNFFGWGRVIGNVELKSHRNVSEVKYVIEGKDREVMYYDFYEWEFYENGLGDVEFIDIKSGRIIQKDYYFAKAIFENRTMNDYEVQCEEKIVNGSSEEVCKNVIVGNHIIQEIVRWEKLENKNIPEEKVRIALVTDVKRNDYIDGVWTIAGKRLTRHGSWQASYDVDLIAYYNFSSLTEPVSGLDLIVGGGTPEFVTNATCFDFDITDDTCGFTSSADKELWNITSQAYFGFDEALSMNISVGGWINRPSAEGDYRGWGNNLAAVSGWGGGFHKSSLHLFITNLDEGEDIHSETGALAFGTWYFFTLTRNDTHTCLWINSTDPVCDVSELASANTEPFTFGGNPDSGEYSTMYFDEWAFWNRTLSPSEISDLYDGGTGTTRRILIGGINVTINSPLNQSYTTTTISFNVTAVDDSGSISGCLYSLNSGVDNYTMINLTTSTDEWTAVNSTMAQGSHTSIFYCNDSDNNLNMEESVTFVIDTLNPDINITFPASNNTNQISNTLEINYTRSDTNLDSCWYSNDTYSVDIILANCANITGITWAEGNHNITIWVNDSVGHENRSSISFFLDSITPDINITFPINKTNYSRNDLEINYTRSDTNLDSCWYSNDLGKNNNTLVGCSNITGITWLEGINNITIWVNDSVGHENSSKVSFFIDTLIPEVNLFYPSINVDYQMINTNITINWTVNDTNLQACVVEYEKTNRTLTCSDNSTQFNITEYNNRTLIFFANDTLGNINLTIRSWNYTIFQWTEIFSETTFEGAREKFEINITTNSSQISSATLIYNNTGFAGVVNNIILNNYTLSANIIIPPFDESADVPFFWSIVMQHGAEINTSVNNQSVSILSLDDCSVFTEVILNYTLLDEEDQTLISSSLNTTIDIEVNISSIVELRTILNFSQRYSNETNPKVCLNLNINDSRYRMDVVTRYSGDTYAAEFNNLQNFSLTNSSVPQHINLFDLKLVDSTEFLITYKGNDFAAVENALIQISRKYIEEGLFKTVEIPKTDKNGQAKGHFDTDNIIYTIIITKNGVNLATFENIVVICEDIVIGRCNINLNAFLTGTPPTDFETAGDINFAMTFNEDTRTISTIFNTIDGSIATVRINTTEFTAYGNRTVCDDSLTSSSGVLTCTIAEGFGNITVLSELLIDGRLVATKFVTIKESAFDTFGYTGIIMLFLFIITIPFFFIGSKIGMVIGVVIGFIIGGLLNIYTGGSIIGVGATLLWLIISALIIIWKLSSEEET